MHRTAIQVRFGDTDALGHINNAVYATYAELGRIDFFRSVAGMYDAPGETGGFILAHIAIDFRSQVRLGQKVEVLSGIKRVGNTSLTVAQQIVADGVVAAEVTAVAVSFDYAAQKPVPVPDRLRELALEHMVE